MVEWNGRIEKKRENSIVGRQWSGGIFVWYSYVFVIHLFFPISHWTNFVEKIEFFRQMSSVCFPNIEYFLEVQQ